jgi:hypothetical protein
MSLEMISEFWSNIVSPRLEAADRREVAEELVSYLIDLNHEPNEIKEYFAGDRNIAKALKDYALQEPADDDTSVSADDDGYLDETLYNSYDDREWD